MTFERQSIEAAKIDRQLRKVDVLTISAQKFDVRIGVIGDNHRSFINLCYQHLLTLQIPVNRS